jgi:hypothetical protein
LALVVLEDQQIQVEQQVLILSLAQLHLLVVDGVDIALVEMVALVVVVVVLALMLAVQAQ